MTGLINMQEMDVELTDEMVKAGVQIIREFDARVSVEEDLAEWIWEAMEAARHKPKSRSGQLLA